MKKSILVIIHFVLIFPISEILSFEINSSNMGENSGAFIGNEYGGGVNWSEAHCDVELECENSTGSCEANGSAAQCGASQDIPGAKYCVDLGGEDGGDQSLTYICCDDNGDFRSFHNDTEGAQEACSDPKYQVM